MTQQKIIQEHATALKEWMNPFLADGVECPCCGKYCREYKRKLNSGMAKMLLAMYLEQGDNQGWVHVTRFTYINGADLGKLNGDYTYLKHWGLLEQKKTEPGEPASGLWRITDLGCKFVRGEVTVPSYVYLVNDHLKKVSKEETSFTTALGNHFDYKELMYGLGKTVAEAVKIYINYADYLKSPDWQKKRQAVSVRSKGVCERCLKNPVVDTHHIVYENIFNEPLEDLWGLCRECHKYVHSLTDKDPDETGYWHDLKKELGRELTAKEVNYYQKQRLC